MGLAPSLFILALLSFHFYMKRITNSVSMQTSFRPFSHSGAFSQLILDKTVSFLLYSVVEVLVHGAYLNRMEVLGCRSPHPSLDRNRPRAFPVFSTRSAEHLVSITQGCVSLADAVSGHFDIGMF